MTDFLRALSALAVDVSIEHGWSITGLNPSPTVEAAVSWTLATLIIYLIFRVIRRR